MDNPQTRCEEHESEVSCTDRAHLNNLGLGTQILLPHCDFQVVELMDQRGTDSSSAEGPRCLPSGKKGPRTEAKGETMEASSTYMAEEELDFEGDDMKVDEGSMSRAHSLVNAQLFEDVAKEEEEGDTTIGLKAKSCKQDARSLLYEPPPFQQLTNPQECGQKRRRYFRGA